MVRAHGDVTVAGAAKLRMLIQKVIEERTEIVQSPVGAAGSKSTPVLTSDLSAEMSAS